MKKTLFAVCIAAIVALAPRAEAAANASIVAPTYGPGFYTAAVTTGDTVQVTVANGFTAIRVLTTSAANDGSLRLWREASVAGGTTTYAVMPNFQPTDWRYTLFIPATAHGWNEYSGFMASKFTLKNGAGTTTTFYVEVR